MQVPVANATKPAGSKDLGRAKPVNFHDEDEGKDDDEDDDEDDGEDEGEEDDEDEDLGDMDLGTQEVGVSATVCCTYDYT